MFVAPLYQPYPLPPRSRRNRIRNLTPVELKNLAEEMASLSEEEDEYDNERQIIREYGYGFMFPIGKTMTQHEEMASEYGDEESEQEEPGDPSAGVELENDGAAPVNMTAEGPDLDAELEDEDANNHYDEDEEEEEDGDPVGFHVHPSQEDDDDDDVMSE